MCFSSSQYEINKNPDGIFIAHSLRLVHVNDIKNPFLNDIKSFQEVHIPDTVYIGTN